MMDQPLPPPSQDAPRAPLSPSDERTWAMLAHFSILLNLVTGFLGTLAALVIYLVFRDRSRFVADQSLQATLFQLAAWLVPGLIAIVLWTVGGILSVVCVGVLLFPLAGLASLLPIAALVYGMVAGAHVYEGRDFRYWLIGDWVRGMQHD
jgi:hypothetical protein